MINFESQVKGISRCVSAYQNQLQVSNLKVIEGVNIFSMVAAFQTGPLIDVMNAPAAKIVTKVNDDDKPALTCLKVITRSLLDELMKAYNNFTQPTSKNNLFTFIRLLSSYYNEITAYRCYYERFIDILDPTVNDPSNTWYPQAQALNQLLIQTEHSQDLNSLKEQVQTFYDKNLKGWFGGYLFQSHQLGTPILALLQEIERGDSINYRFACDKFVAFPNPESQDDFSFSEPYVPQYLARYDETQSSTPSLPTPIDDNRMRNTM